MVNRQAKVIPHADLSGDDLALLRDLFDSEYFPDFGPWKPDAPYGYSPADLHTLVWDGSALLAHVGFQVRTIDVGGQEVSVAGTGGVLVDSSCRGAGLGREVMAHAAQAMHDHGGVDFGYLGCREQVVPFYESAGWNRIHATEHHVSRLDQHSVVVSMDTPILIYPVAKPTSQWPSGDVHLRGTPW
jgi:aminoglycoside 2'-N-acetyltransferase I